MQKRSANGERPAMRFVAIKSERQQAAGRHHRGRDPADEAAHDAAEPAFAA